MRSHTSSVQHADNPPGLAPATSKKRGQRGWTESLMDGTGQLAQVEDRRVVRTGVGWGRGGVGRELTRCVCVCVCGGASESHVPANQVGPSVHDSRLRHACDCSENVHKVSCM